MHSVFGLATFLACAPVAASRWCIDDRIRARDARSALFPLCNCGPRLVTDKAFATSFENSSSDPTHVLLALWRTQKRGWYESSCVGWSLCSLAEVVVELFEAFRVLGRKRVTEEELRPSETFPEALVTWLSEDC